MNSLKLYSYMLPNGLVPQDIWQWNLLLLKLLLLTVSLILIIRGILFLLVTISSSIRKPQLIPELKFPRVDVVIPCFNEEVNIVKTIEALLRLEYPNYGIVIVDDGSTDDTWLKATQHFGESSQVKLLQQNNSGKSAALNHGIKCSQAEIIICIDADTLIESKLIGKIVPLFSARDVAAVSGYLTVGNNMNLLTSWQDIEYCTVQNFERKILSVLNSVIVVPGAIGAFRRKAVLEVGGFSNDTLTEDSDITVRLLQRGYQIKNAPHAVASTEAPETLAMFLRQRIRWTYGTIQYLLKHSNHTFKGDTVNIWLIYFPYVWTFRILLPLLTPLLDYLFMVSLFHGEPFWPYLYFMVLDVVVTCAILTSEKRRLQKVGVVILQRLAYKQIILLAILRAIVQFISQKNMGWKKITRTGHVVAHDVNCEQQYYDASPKQIHDWNMNHAAIRQGYSPEIMVVKISGKNLHEKAFKKAIRAIILRHESLRTVFLLKHNTLKQKVLPYNPITYRVLFYDMKAGKHEGFMDEICAKYQKQIVLLDKGPLIRILVFENGETFYCRVIVHHIVFDAWSMEIFKNELKQFYEQYKNEEKVQIEKPKAQLKDHVARQLALLSRNNDRDKTYWLIKLKGKLRPVAFENFYHYYASNDNGRINHHGLSLPLAKDDLLELVKARASAMYGIVIEKDMYSMIKVLSAKSGCGVVAILCASFYLLFLKLFAESRVIMAMPVHGRSKKELFEIIGNFTGGIYLVSQMESEASVTKLISCFYSEFLQSSRHIIFNHDAVGLDEQNLRKCCAIFINYIRQDSGKAASNKFLGHHRRDGEHYILNNIITEYPDGIVFLWCYNLKFYNCDMIEYLADKHLRILKTMCESDDVPIRHIISG